MHVRLAFAVAAHLEPEILVVDEVLAVGDAEFQKKCLGKMSEVAGGGRTVLFVSHNMDAVRRICVSGMLLSSGRLALRGGVNECIDQYLIQALGRSQTHELQFPVQSRQRPHILRIELLDEKNEPLPRPGTWDHVKFRIHFYSPTRVKNGSVELYLSTSSGALLTRCSTSPDSDYPMEFSPGENCVDCDFPRLTLSAGSFIVGAGLALPNVEWFDNQPHAAVFEVESRDVFNSGFAPNVVRYPVPMAHTWCVPSVGTSLQAVSVSATQQDSAITK
jgi:lipopolysaccharide transport system ATP-binding protein